MARITVASLTVQIAALEARLAVGHEVCRNQRARIAELEARVATPGVKTEPSVTTYYDRAGNLWEKTRVGNRATSRMVSVAEYNAQCDEVAA